MRKMILAGVCGICLLLAGQTRPTTQSAVGFADYSITDARIQDLKGFTYFHTSRKISIRQMNHIMDAEVQRTVAAARSRISGPLVLIMHNMTGNPDQLFDVETGFPVNPGGEAPDGFAIINIPTKRFATVIFSGSLMQMGAAYHKLYSAIFGAGMMPGEESRQYFLYWEGIDSVNNVVMISVEVQ
jgi:effector-binding domain-containing protein